MGEFGRWVVIAGIDMQARNPVYMKNRKGRKQARKCARILRNTIRYFKDREAEARAHKRT